MRGDNRGPSWPVVVFLAFLAAAVVFIFWLLLSEMARPAPVTPIATADAARQRFLAQLDGALQQVLDARDEQYAKLPGLAQLVETPWQIDFALALDGMFSGADDASLRPPSERVELTGMLLTGGECSLALALSGGGQTLSQGSFDWSGSLREAGLSAGGERVCFALADPSESAMLIEFLFSKALGGETVDMRGCAALPDDLKACFAKMLRSGRFGEEEKDGVHALQMTLPAGDAARALLALFEQNPAANSLARLALRRFDLNGDLEGWLHGGAQGGEAALVFSVEQDGRFAGAQADLMLPGDGGLLNSALAFTALPDGAGGLSVSLIAGDTSCEEDYLGIFYERYLQDGVFTEGLYTESWRDGDFIERFFELGFSPQDARDNLWIDAGKIDEAGQESYLQVFATLAALRDQPQLGALWLEGGGGDFYLQMSGDAQNRPAGEERPGAGLRASAVPPRRVRDELGGSFDDWWRDAVLQLRRTVSGARGGHAF